MLPLGAEVMASRCAVVMRGGRNTFVVEVISRAAGPVGKVLIPNEPVILISPLLAKFIRSTLADLSNNVVAPSNVMLEDCQASNPWRTWLAPFQVWNSMRASRFTAV